MADHPVLPGHNTAGETGISLRDGGRGFLQFLRMIPEDAMNFIDRESQPVSLPFSDHQAVAKRALALRVEIVINAQQPPQADTNQQLAAYVHQAQYHTVPPVG